MKELLRALIIGTIILLLFLIFPLLSNYGMNNGKKPVEDKIVLTEQNKELVEVIYNKREVWERKPNGSLCQYCFFSNVDGVLYFECAFNDSASKKYKIQGNSFAEHDYLKDNQGFIAGRLLTPSMPNYNYYATDKEKHIYVENLIKELQEPQK